MTFQYCNTLHKYKLHSTIYVTFRRSKGQQGDSQQGSPCNTQPVKFSGIFFFTCSPPEPCVLIFYLYSIHSAICHHSDRPVRRPREETRTRNGRAGILTTRPSHLPKFSTWTCCVAPLCRGRAGCWLSAASAPRGPWGSTLHIIVIHTHTGPTAILNSTITLPCNAVTVFLKVQYRYRGKLFLMGYQQTPLTYSN